ncbi:MAG: class I SAM-dependent methyltransferase [Nanoarchaeota archaeon]|nr:class I SAM-dependent methyltransferase [Nanoarchaeota archaeon]
MKSKDWDRISKDYYKEIISPIKDSVGKNLLLERIEYHGSKQKVVADLGCGIGPLLGILSKKYKHVYALDYSKEMVEQSQNKNKSRKNISYHVRDFSNLSILKNKLDVAISVNSFLAEDTKKLNKIIKQIYNSLKNKGVFIGVLPAMESYLYQAVLIREKRICAGDSEKKASNKAQKLIKIGNYDFVKGTITFDGDIEKTFYEFEILYRFRKAGFKNIKVSKIYYDWKEWKKAGQTYFPKEEPPWDWFVECQK